MKGWRPSAIPKGPKPVRALLRANSMPDIGSIGLSFPQDPVPGRMSRDPRTRGFLFALIGSAAAEVGQITPERPRS